MSSMRSKTQSPRRRRLRRRAATIALVLVATMVPAAVAQADDQPGELVPASVGTAAPVRQLPICEELVDPDAFQCPRNAGPLAIVSTGALSGNGSVQVRVTPLIPPCEHYDPGSKTWTPSRCYSRVAFADTGACFYYNDGRQRLESCHEPEYRDGTYAGSDRDFPLTRWSMRLGTGGELVESSGCGAASNFGVYAYGGPLPDRTWAQVAPTVLECTLSIDRTPDNLWGATWHRYGVSLFVQESGDPDRLEGGYAEVFYRVEGTLGPNAPGIIEPEPNPFEPVGPFTDVPTTSFARGDIALLLELEITTGISATEYGPAQPVSREQMASFLARTWRALGQRCPAAASPFGDVAQSSFAYDDATCIFEIGVTTGVGGGRYDPGGFVTREQMASFLARIWRTLGNACPDAATGFVDVAATSFAHDDIRCIFGLGVTNGTSASTYGPGERVTREQMAAFLGRIYRAATA